MTTLADRWRQLGPFPRAIVSLLGFLVAINVLISGVGTITGGADPGGPRSSSYATGDDGLAAYADLLVRFDHPVRRIRVALGDTQARLIPESTLVLTEPRSLAPADMVAIVEFVEQGGRLVVTGLEAAPLLDRLVGRGDGPRVDTVSDDELELRLARPASNEPEAEGITGVTVFGTSSWAAPGAMKPLLETDDRRVVAVAADVGRGRVLALSETEPLQNLLLAHTDNAAFALALAGEPRRPVAFSEIEHGYGRSSGIWALPRRWRWALAGAAVAAFVWLWSRGKRFGPPDQFEPEHAPARRLYVDSVAAILADTRQPAAATEPLRQHAIRRLLTRASIQGVRPDQGDTAAEQAAIRDAGTTLGLDADDMDALLRPPTGDADVLALGRAAARIGGSER